MQYQLKFSKLFDKEFSKLGKTTKEEAWKKIQRLKQTPEAGKHLRHLNLWELRVKMFRIFYLIDSNQMEIILLSMKHKDETDRYMRSLSLETLKRVLDGAS